MTQNIVTLMHLTFFLKFSTEENIYRCNIITYSNLLRFEIKKIKKENHKVKTGVTGDRCVLRNFLKDVMVSLHQSTKPILSS